MRELTDEQTAAADRRSGELLLGAGAGSGKTAVLVERAVRAIAVDGVAPGAILAITFTNRAAAEMRARVLAATAADSAPQVMTVHAFCGRLTRANALRLGVDPGFAVLDAAQAATLRAAALRAALGELAGTGTDVLAAYTHQLAEIVIGTHEQLRSRGIDHPLLPAHTPPAPVEPARLAFEQAARDALAALDGVDGKLVAEARTMLAGPLPDLPTPGELDALRLGNGANALKTPACEAYRDAHSAFARRCADARADAALQIFGRLLASFGAAYSSAKQERAALDYEDLQLHARRLLTEDQALREGLRERIALLMVDEFQDVNPLQMEIVELLQRDNLCSVGDESQSIYGFRHADVGLMRARREKLGPGGASLQLTINFRSRPEILDVVNAVFADRLGAGFLRLRAAREPAGEPRVELLAVEQEGEWRRAEADVLARRIAQLVAPGTSVAVLLRAATDIVIYETALRERGIATAAAAGAYWSSIEVGDLLAYLRALANPLDGPALLALRASPLVGDGPDALLDDEWGPDWFVAERVEAPRRTVAELLERVIAARSYDRSLLAQPDGERRLANVRKLVALARAWDGGSLRDFIEHVQRQVDAGSSEPDAPVADDGAVRLMTIHAAKGLEFDVVAVADLGRRPNTRAPDLLTDGRRIGLRARALDGSSAPALDYERLRDERLAAERQEEDRVFYVAMTRARERLLLSGALKTDGPIDWLAPALGCDGLGAEPVDELRHPPADLAAQVCCRYLPAPPSTDDAPPPPASQRLTPAPPRAPAPSPGVPPLPETVSYSSLVALERCAYRWYVERVLGMPERVEEARSHGGGLARGRLAHALLERGIERPDADDVLEQGRRDGEPVQPAEAARIAALLSAAAGSELALRLVGAAREQPFQFELGEGLPLVTGALDAIVRDGDGGCLVVDYKTDHVGDGDLAELTADRYGLQREIYALAALTAGARTVEVAHWFLERPHEPQIATFGQPDRERLLEALRARIAPMLSGSYPVSERPCRELCLTCPARDGLCVHPPELTLREEV